MAKASSDGRPMASSDDRPMRPSAADGWRHGRARGAAAGGWWPAAGGWRHGLIELLVLRGDAGSSSISGCCAGPGAVAAAASSADAVHGAAGAVAAATGASTASCHWCRSSSTSSSGCSCCRSPALRAGSTPTMPAALIRSCRVATTVFGSTGFPIKSATSSRSMRPSQMTRMDRTTAPRQARCAESALPGPDWRSMLA